MVVPAGLLEQKRRTQFTFKVVMICIAGISLLVGGIGIMNIMLATVLERTREIGIRRAIGARQADIIRQFLTEAVLISIIGGLIGIAFGFTLSRIIAAAAGWSTVVTATSIGVAFGVSVGIGLCSEFIRPCRRRNWIPSKRSDTSRSNLCAFRYLLLRLFAAHGSARGADRARSFPSRPISSSTSRTTPTQVELQPPARLADYVVGRTSWSCR